MIGYILVGNGEEKFFRGQRNVYIAADTAQDQLPFIGFEHISLVGEFLQETIPVPHAVSEIVFPVKETCKCQKENEKNIAEDSIPTGFLFGKTGGYVGWCWHQEEVSGFWSLVSGFWFIVPKELQSRGFQVFTIAYSLLSAISYQLSAISFPIPSQPILINKINQCSHIHSTQ